MRTRKHDDRSVWPFGGLRENLDPAAFPEWVFSIRRAKGRGMETCLYDCKYACYTMDDGLHRPGSPPGIRRADWFTGARLETTQRESKR